MVTGLKSSCMQLQDRAGVLVSTRLHSSSETLNSFQQCSLEVPVKVYCRDGLMPECSQIEARRQVPARICNISAGAARAEHHRATHPCSP